MKLWTIYERPAEYPNLYVARESEVGGNEDAPRTKRMKFSSDLSALRKQMEQLGLTQLQARSGGPALYRGGLAMSRNTAGLRTCGPKEEVRVWHRADMPAVLSDVRCPLLGAERKISARSEDFTY
jgi:hypothetical protein